MNTRLMRLAAYRGDRAGFDALARNEPAGTAALAWKAGTARARLGLPPPSLDDAPPPSHNPDPLNDEPYLEESL